MKKQNLTPEQRAKSDERKAARRAFAARVGKMSEEERAAISARFPVATIEGRVLSVHNQCLIALQGGATIVGGFKQWREAGRAVRKGGHSVGIWCPIGCGKQADDQGAEIKADGERTGFIMGSVFDISQTDELPAESEEAS